MGVFGEPPTPQSSYPDIPIPQFEPAGEQFGKGLAKARKDADFVHKLWFALLDLISFCVTFLMGGIDDVFARFVHILTAGQATGQPGFLALMSAVIGDLLGIEYNEEELIQTMQKGGRVKTMVKAGGWLFDTLRMEFDPSGGTTQQQASDQPARAFLGFLLEFAIRQGNVAMFAEFLPPEFNFFAGLREYGELMARNLGLGRLARQALRPLMQVMVADPLLWKLNSIYRPKLLTSAQAVKAHKRGALSRDELNKILAYEGYSDSAIEILLFEDVYQWHARELMELVRLGEIDELEAATRLTSDKVDDDTAADLWKAYTGEATQNLQRQYLSELYREVREGLRTNAYAQNIIDTAHLLPSERELWKHIFGELAERPSRRLTESEIERAFLGGIIDMTRAQAFWQGLGYDDEAIGIHTLLLLQKQSASNRTRAGSTPHRHLTEAQLEKSYNSGILNLAQLQAGWHALGYTADDISVLSALVQLKTPAPGETLFPGMTTP